MNSDNDLFFWDFKSNWHFCRFCKHLHSLIGKPTCDAFPEGIPKELTSTLILHDKPMLGQKNHIVFVPTYK
jgi:hypothetical protein